MHDGDRRSSMGKKGNDAFEVRKAALWALGIMLFLLSATFSSGTLMRRPDLFLQVLLLMAPLTIVFWVVAQVNKEDQR